MLGRSMRTSIVFVLLVLQCSSIDPQLASGQQSGQLTDANSLFDVVKPRAEAGDPQAQYLLGEAYSKGLGVSMDYREAAIWWTRAAEQGLPAAQYDLGRIYKHGSGVPRDYGQSVKWYRKAANQGLAVAENDLALAYLHGLGVPRDVGQYVKLLSMAAEKGEVSAQHNLGEAYLLGQGVPRDFAKALDWFRRLPIKVSVTHTTRLAICIMRARGYTEVTKMQ
jgi:hypothetical protein